MTENEIGIRAAAAILGVHENTVRRYIDQGRLKARPMAGRSGFRRLAKADVLALQAEIAHETDEQILRRAVQIATRDDHRPITRQLEYLLKEILVYEVGRLNRELEPYRKVDRRPWFDWVSAILASPKQTYARTRNGMIAEGLAAPVHAAIGRWRTGNATDTGLVLLVPKTGWDALDNLVDLASGDQPASFLGIPIKVVPGLAWPVVGVELERPADRD